QYRGLVDLIDEVGLVWTDDDDSLGKEFTKIEIPEDLRDQVKEYREKMIEGLAEVDEHLMEKYVHGEPITPAELKAAVRKGTISMKLFPILCGASFKNKGVQPLLDAVIDYLPSPLDIPPMQGVNPETKAVEAGRAGDIAAAIGLKLTTTGDTLCDPDRPIVLESLAFPEPVIAVAIEPKTRADEEKLGVSLSRLALEDPTFRVTSDEETAQTLIHGMGELHLEIIVDRLLREFKVEANVGKPQVAYRETIRKAAEAQGRYVRQTGGRGQYGDVYLEVEPNEPGKGFEFENKIIGGSIPREYIPAVEKGIREALDTGVLAGYPIVDIRVRLTDGSYHEVDSSEMAVKIAASLGVPGGCGRAKPVRIEPGVGGEGRVPLRTTSRRPHNGEGEVRADEAARERGDDWAHRPRQDDVDGGDHQGAAHEEQDDRGAGVRVDRQRAGRPGAGDHDRGGARGVRDGEAALRAHRLSGACGLH